jgi:hypothetical protein
VQPFFPTTFLFLFLAMPCSFTGQHPKIATLQFRSSSYIFPKSSFEAFLTWDAYSSLWVFSSDILFPSILPITLLLHAVQNFSLGLTKLICFYMFIEQFCSVNRHLYFDHFLIPFIWFVNGLQVFWSRWYFHSSNFSWQIVLLVFLVQLSSMVIPCFKCLRQHNYKD